VFIGPFTVERVRTGSGSTSWTVADALGLPVRPVDEYLGFLVALSRSPNTVCAYGYDLRLFLECLETEGLEWTDVTVDTMAAFVRWLEQPAGNVVLTPGAAPARRRATIARAVSAVYSFYDFHATRGVPVATRLVSFKAVPGAHWRQRSSSHRRMVRRAVAVNVTKPLPRTLTREQVAMLIGACRRQRDAFLLALMYETGMRVGQALGLRHEDFVSRHRLLRIVPRDDNPNGARAKTSRITEICVSGELVRRYSDYMVDEYGPLDSDFVFVNLWSQPVGAPMSRSGVNELTRALRRRTGISFTPHMLRHTNATELQRAGVPLEVISHRLCHANLTTTAAIYIHLTVEDQRRELEAVGFWEPAS